MVGVDVAENGAAGERSDEKELCQRHDDHLHLRLRSTLRVHRHVAHVAAEHVEQDRDERQVGEHGHEEVAAIAVDERSVLADGRRQMQDGEQVQRRQTDAEERQSAQHKTDADSRAFVEMKRYRQHLSTVSICKRQFSIISPFI